MVTMQHNCKSHDIKCKYDSEMIQSHGYKPILSYLSHIFLFPEMYQKKTIVSGAIFMTPCVTILADIQLHMRQSWYKVLTTGYQT